MLKIIVLLLGILLVMTVNATEVSDYTVEQLIEPCTEVDNDAGWGRGAEVECEQIIKGFADAYVLLTKDRQQDEICLPIKIHPNEIRLEFMRWAILNFDERENSAADGLLTAMKTAYPCQ